jgi:CheY-like chemotaxis protein
MSEPVMSEPIMSERGGGKTVLIVAREPSVLVLLRSMFEHQGFRVLLAGSGAEASELLTLRNIPVRVTVSDVEFADDIAGTPGSFAVVHISSTIECDSVRIRLMRRVGEGYFTQDTHTSLVEAVNVASSLPLLSVSA